MYVSARGKLETGFEAIINTHNSLSHEKKTWVLDELAVLQL